MGIAGQQLNLFDFPMPPRAPDASVRASRTRCSLQRPQLIPRGEAKASKEKPSTSAKAAPPTISSLNDVLEIVVNARADVSQRDAIASAVRMVGKAISKPLDRIPAEPIKLAPLLGEVSLATIGMKPERWSRIRTHLRTALTLAGIDVLPGRDVSGLDPAWERLAATIPDLRRRNGLSRIMSYFSRHNIGPDQVRPAHFDQFQQALVHQSLHAKPEVLYRKILALWNSAAEDIEGWPPKAPPPTKDTRCYSLEWDALPDGFQRDVEAYLTARTDDDPFAEHYARPLSPSTVRARRLHLRQLASALLDSGEVSASELTGLDVLLLPRNAEIALRRLMERDGSKVVFQRGTQTRTLLATAKWMRRPAGEIDRLARFAQRLTPRRSGMAPKNRRRLRQFDLPANLEALLTLPQRVLAETLPEENVDRATAQRFMCAIAVELLTVAPVRMKNLAALELDRHFRATRRGREEVVHIVIPSEETKNGVPFETPLPRKTARMISVYVENYRPQLGGERSNHLFPGRDKPGRLPGSLGNTISKFILRETGLQMHPHLFRQLAGKMYLDHHPDQLEVVRQFLGHRRSETTEGTYVEFEVARAHARFLEMLCARRAAATSHSPKRASGRRKALNA